MPATPEHVRAALCGSRTLGEALAARVPDSWPPEYLDGDAYRYTLERLGDGCEQQGWWLYFVLLGKEHAASLLIGSAGYKGPPTEDGTVEIGYGIVFDQRRRGYATEVTHGLLQNAFAHAAVQRAIGETLPELTASIGVLEKCGFRRVEEGSETGILRFALARRDWANAHGAAGAL
ncbi:MAG TPA: GNAT family N-acetyltransferase [Planctomycetota bacterium]